MRASAGTLVCVPPLVVHGFRNASDAPMRYLNLHAPGVGFATYMRGGLRDGVKVVYDQEDPPAGRPPPRRPASAPATRRWSWTACCCPPTSQVEHVATARVLLRALRPAGGHLDPVPAGRAVRV